jgi:PIN domain nuclease of toxin-antitoxin system
LVLRQLPDLHWDPIDRILPAQDNAEGLMFISSGQALCGYGKWSGWCNPGEQALASRRSRLARFF